MSISKGQEVRELPTQHSSHPPTCYRRGGRGRGQGGRAGGRRGSATRPLNITMEVVSPVASGRSGGRVCRGPDADHAYNKPSTALTKTRDGRAGQGVG
ncbi:hypothetical protein E2C01_091995 [Portunus trituberculatus]|uniref:Uncharacterized protein n=1 Tax=Portunus trituberculatus TaxID=210409 RepID=A0A5B7JPG3_PORTR|nr:hypothetical protein [Portunus trituberculatus]